MPINPLNTEAYSIKELTLNADGNGCYISLVCARATAYVLCFSSGEPMRYGDLSLTEEELHKLHGGSVLEKDNCRLQGVRKQVFDAMPVFRGFKATPPEQIQVWSMDTQANGDVVLYIPETAGSETCYVPMRYSSAFEPGRAKKGGDDTVGYLTVRLEDDGKYTDGVLQYQVGDCLPIPIPESLLNSRIPLFVEEGCPVRVVVDERYTGQYMQT